MQSDLPAGRDPAAHTRSDFLLHTRNDRHRIESNYRCVSVGAGSAHTLMCRIEYTQSVIAIENQKISIPHTIKCFNFKCKRDTRHTIEDT